MKWDQVGQVGHDIFTAVSDFGTYNLGEQLRLRQACASEKCLQELFEYSKTCRKRPLKKKTKQRS